MLDSQRPDYGLVSEVFIGSMMLKHFTIVFFMHLAYDHAVVDRHSVHLHWWCRLDFILYRRFARNGRMTTCKSRYDLRAER